MRLASLQPARFTPRWACLTAPLWQSQTTAWGWKSRNSSMAYTMCENRSWQLTIWQSWLMWVFICILQGCRLRSEFHPMPLFRVLTQEPPQGSGRWAVRTVSPRKVERIPDLDGRRWHLEGCWCGEISLFEVGDTDTVAAVSPRTGLSLPRLWVYARWM